MERERLTISLTRVTVEFEFLNNTDRDITVEVAFPVPPYNSDFPTAPLGFRISEQAFPDEEVWEFRHRRC